MMKIQLLCTEKDRQTLQPVLEELAKKGVKIAQKGEMTLCALSESFYADEPCMEALLTALGKDGVVLPLQLDAAPLPEALKNALYARNILSAEGREASLLAERITAALPKKRSRLPLWLTLGGAAALAAIGLFVWNGSKTPPPEEEPLPVMVQEPEVVIPIPGGWTQEELEKIYYAVIVGDRAEFYTWQEMERNPYGEGEFFAYREENDGAPRWYSREDGHEYAMERYEDLRFLQLMPRLTELTLVCVDCGQLPELSGLEKLTTVRLLDCAISDLDWVKGGVFQHMTIYNSTGSLTDLGALSECEKLKELELDLMNTRKMDLSALSPKKLGTLRLYHAEDLAQADLSSLRNCAFLHTVELQNVPIRDLSFLENAQRLETLRMNGLHELRDVSALAGKDKLKDLLVHGCEQLTDFSAVAGCVNLQEFNYDCWEGARLRDASFLSNIPTLMRLHLGGVELENLDFLKELGKLRGSLSLDLSGSVGEYSGLASFGEFNRLTLDLADASWDKVAPWLAEAGVGELTLRDITGVDLSTLPRVRDRVELCRCDLTDLSTMPADWAVPELCLESCAQLRSLDGLDNQSFLGDKKGVLEVKNCPRLTDWDALNGMAFARLSLTAVYTLPDFAAIQPGTLRLDSVPEVEDLSILEGMDTERSCNFELLGLDVTNLKPLERFHGVHLAVPPELRDQAQELVDAGCFKEVRVEFPEGGWEEDQGSIMLADLSELDTLPGALLRRVERLIVVGDQIIDPGRFRIEEDWEHRDANGFPALAVEDMHTGETFAVGKGTIRDLSALSKLTGLRELRLYGQPLQSLEGIQRFYELETLSVRFSPGVRDVSPAFACQQLRDLNFDNQHIDSIQGAQNLWGLRRINIAWTNVSDLTPLLELEELERVVVSEDMKAAVESLDGAEYGFELEIVD